MIADPKRLFAILAAVAAGAVMWYLAAPTALGGSADYSITSGTSMEPRFHSGDLAIVQAKSDYRVGDIVLYRSPIVHRPVLHRILAIQHGHYFFKGDHNNFVDPGFVTRADLVGKLSLRVPWVGHLLGWIGSPLHAALIAAAAMLLLAGGAFSARRRRRGRRLNFPAVPHLHRLPVAGSLAAGAALTTVGLMLAVVGFSTASTRATPHTDAYQQAGEFFYSARTTRPTASYPSGVVMTGQPLFLSVLRRVHFGFRYRFESKLPHVVHGTIALAAELSSQTSLRNTYALDKPDSFSGDTVGDTYDLPVAFVTQLLTKLAEESGSLDGSYSVALQAIVKVQGFVDGVPISDTFSPSLNMTLTKSSIRIAESTPSALPGAGYAPPSPAQLLARVLHPQQPGTDVSITVENQARLLRWRVGVGEARFIGIALFLLGLAFLAGSRAAHKRQPARPEEERIAARHRVMLIPVASLESAGSADAITVLDFTSLARLAHYCERPILLESTVDERIYGIEDDGHLYVYRASLFTNRSPVHKTAPLASRQLAARRRGRKALKGSLVALALVVGLSIATSFTATTTVPLSYAGVSSQARTIAQLAPPQCAGLTLTHLVIATGSSVTGSSGNDLILGRNATGTLYLSASGGSDCIVAGGRAGTTNRIDGGSWSGNDVCIGAPGAVNQFNNCAKTY